MFQWSFRMQWFLTTKCWHYKKTTEIHKIQIPTKKDRKIRHISRYRQLVQCRYSKQWMLFPPTIKTLNMQFSNYCFFSSLSFQELFPNFFLKNTFKIVFFAAFLFRSFFQTFFLKNTFQIVFLQPFFSGAFSRLFFKKKYFPNCFFCSLSF